MYLDFLDTMLLSWKSDTMAQADAVFIHKTTLRYIPESCHLHVRRRKILQPHIRNSGAIYLYVGVYISVCVCVWRNYEVQDPTWTFYSSSLKMFLFYILSVFIETRHWIIFWVSSIQSNPHLRILFLQRLVWYHCIYDHVSEVSSSQQVFLSKFCMLF
jgi:hypothetical protein